MLLWFTKMYISWACFKTREDLMQLCQVTNQVATFVFMIIVGRPNRFHEWKRGYLGAISIMVSVFISPRFLKFLLEPYHPHYNGDQTWLVVGKI